MQVTYLPSGTLLDNQAELFHAAIPDGSFSSWTRRIASHLATCCVAMIRLISRSTGIRLALRYLRSREVQGPADPFLPSSSTS